MKKIAKPNDLPEEVFRKCISRIQDKCLKERLGRCEKEIISSSKEFEDKVINAELHTISSVDNTFNIVTAKEMAKVYTDRMAKKSSPGREIYDKLMALPKYGRCPFCNHRLVSTLDHHLPKAHYPFLAVTPINLVPTCRDCNTMKKDSIPQTRYEETIHPYFDDIENDSWLKCDVIKGEPASFRFYVSSPTDWDRLLSKRVEYHFKILRLDTLYSSNAAHELLNILGSLKDLFAKGGKINVQFFLQDAESSRVKVCKNSWQAAMYKALATDDWFCDGGFQS